MMDVEIDGESSCIPLKKKRPFKFYDAGHYIERLWVQESWRSKGRGLKGNEMITVTHQKSYSHCRFSQ
jgi:hypothetical protein